MPSEFQTIQKVELNGELSVEVTHNSDFEELSVALVSQGEDITTIINTIEPNAVDPVNVMDVTFSQAVPPSVLFVSKLSGKPAFGLRSNDRTLLTNLVSNSPESGKIDQDDVSSTNVIAGRYAVSNGAGGWTYTATPVSSDFSHSSLQDLGADDHAQYQLRSELNLPNGYAGVDGTGKIPSSLIPADALPSTYVVDTLVERDALMAVEGDVAYVVETELFYIYDGAAWIELNVGGDVTGPMSATTNALVRYVDTTGKVIKNSNAILDDAGNLVLQGNLTLGGDVSTPGSVDGIDISNLNDTTTAHIADTANPHATDIGNLGSGTLAELNSKITDATLDGVGASRPPNLHKATHELGGTDILIAQNLSSNAAPAGKLMQANGSGGWVLIDTPPVISEHSNLNGLTDDDHLQYLNRNGIRAMTGDLDMGTNNVTNVGTVDGIDVSALNTTTNNHIADTDNPHSTSIANLGSGTLAQLNAIVTDATLDASTAARTPTAHASSHISGGSDEIDGDRLDIDYVPTNYTRTITAPATSTDHLTSHLSGINAAIGAIGGIQVLYTNTNTTTQTTTTNVYVNNTPGTNYGLQLRHQFTVNVTTAGTYRLDLSYVWNYDSTNADFISSLWRVGAPQIAYFHREEPQDSAGDVGGTGSSQQYPASWFGLFTLNPGSYEFRFGWGTSTAGVESSIFNSSVMFYRVA